MHGIEAQSRHPVLLTPSVARLRPALVVTSSFREHHDGTSFVCISLIADLRIFRSAELYYMSNNILLSGRWRRALRGWSPGPSALACATTSGTNAFQRSLS